jgi:hypothetical protein
MTASERVGEWEGCYEEGQGSLRTIVSENKEEKEEEEKKEEEVKDERRRKGRRRRMGRRRRR